MIGRDRIERILREAGIELNGSHPFDIRVYDDRAFQSARRGARAIGEAFMESWWDADDVAEVIFRLRRSKQYRMLVPFDARLLQLQHLFGNKQSASRSRAVAHHHYDLGNSLYKTMLDTQMVYSCARWNGESSLEAAQEAKYEMICEWLGVKEGDRILDIGCGWGSFMRYAAERRGAICVGLTVSERQAAFCREWTGNLPIECIVADYREFTARELFDHVVSIEMIEAVGPKNFRTYFSLVHHLLKPGGRFFLQTSGSSDPHPIPSTWLDAYIFPNGVMPSLPQLERGMRVHFKIDRFENIGSSYDRVLMEWWRRFERGFPVLQANDPRYDERFFRMWKFYLQSCAGYFRAGEGQNWQMLLTRMPD